MKTFVVTLTKFVIYKRGRYENQSEKIGIGNKDDSFLGY